MRNTRRRRRRLHTLTRTHNKSFRIRYTKLSQLLFELSKMLSNYRSLYKMIEKEKWREKSTSMCHLDSMLILLLLAFTFFFRSFIASTVVWIVVVVLYSCIFEFIVCSPNAVPHMPNLLCNIFIYYYDYSKRLLFDRYMWNRKKYLPPPTPSSSNSNDIVIVHKTISGVRVCVPNHISNAEYEIIYDCDAVDANHDVINATDERLHFVRLIDTMPIYRGAAWINCNRFIW